jgi:hypothetical protein
MNVGFYRDSLRLHGLAATMGHAVYRAANHVTTTAVWNALALSEHELAPSYRAEARTALGRLVDANEMLPYVSDTNRLTAEFVHDAIAKGDRCYAIFDGDSLASYGWYSAAPTRLSEISTDLTLHFDPGYVYMYNAYTMPQHRGRRLHAIGMAAALQSFVREGKQGLVSYVDCSNFASMKSCERLGYRTIGRLVVLQVGDRYACWATPGCERYGVHITPARGVWS